MANKTKLSGRAQKQARQMLRGRLAGSLGKNYKNLGLSQRAQIDKKLEGKKAVIARLAKRLMPKVKKAEMTRLSKARKTRNEGFEQLAVIESVYDVVMSENITEKVERNLMKKSEKYGVNFEELKDKYLAYKGIMNENATFDAINSELANINEDDKPNKRGDDTKGHKRPTEDGAGLTRKGAKAAGVKTAVTTPPSKLDPNGKAAKRRKSFCARMGGMKGPMKDEKGRPTRKAMSLRRWNC